MRFIIILALVLIECNIANPARGDNVAVDGPSSAANTFAANLYGHLPANSNLICSPLSIYCAMAMTAEGARGRTAAEMSAAGVTHEGSVRLIADLDSPDPDFQLNIANALWARTGFRILPQFQDLLAKDYGCALFSLDFSDPVAAGGQINGWVSQKTNGKIPELFSPGSLPPNAALVLTNAIYFHADWELPFESERSELGNFYVPGQTQPQRRMMMNESGSFPLMHGDEFDALELPYKGGKMSMLIVLPKSADGLAALESKFSESFLNHVVGGLEPAFVDVAIPKFSFSWQDSLRAPLMSMGIHRAFSAAEADFSGMDDGGHLFLSDVVHKAFVAVDEKGTEAAAATGVIMLPTAIVSPQNVFIADHPFLFLIRDQTTGAVLFIGRVCDPPKN